MRKARRSVEARYHNIDAGGGTEAAHVTASMLDLPFKYEIHVHTMFFYLFFTSVAISIVFIYYFFANFTLVWYLYVVFRVIIFLFTF